MTLRVALQRPYIKDQYLRGQEVHWSIRRGKIRKAGCDEGSEKLTGLGPLLP